MGVRGEMQSREKQYQPAGISWGETEIGQVAPTGLDALFCFASLGSSSVVAALSLGLVLGTGALTDGTGTDTA